MEYLIERIKSLILKPGETWSIINKEEQTVSYNTGIGCHSWCNWYIDHKILIIIN